MEGRSSQRAGSAGASPHGRRRTVLVIATRFPPAQGPGALRLAKTVTYLRDFGWFPVVVTAVAAQGGSTPRQQESIAVPRGTPVVRIPTPCSKSWMDAVAPLLRAGSILGRAIGISDEVIAEGLRWRIDRGFDSLAFPDPGTWRLPTAVRAAKRLDSLWHFDAIFSSGMPFSDHVIAGAIQAVLRRPWIAEFRDPWVDYVHAPQWHSVWGRCMTRLLERLVVQRARRIVTVSPAITEQFRRRYPRESPSKFVTVLNGFDPDDLAAAAADRREFQGRFTVFHAGSFYGQRRAVTLLKAFERFVSLDARRAEQASLVFAGRLGPDADRVKEAACTAPVHHAGVLPHRQTLGCMQSAAANVLIMSDAPGSEGDVSSKLYEYLGAGNAILAAAPARGAAADLLRPHAGVWRVDPGDEGGMTRALEEMYALWQSDRLRPRRDEQLLRSLTRVSQTQRLARELDAIA